MKKRETNQDHNKAELGIFENKETKMPDTDLTGEK